MEETRYLLDETCFTLDRNTVIIEHPLRKTSRAYYHDHPIMVMTPTDITIHVKGVLDSKTLHCIKRVAHYYGLWFSIYSSCGTWYIDTIDNHVMPFHNNMTFRRVLTPPEVPKSPDIVDITDPTGIPTSFLFDRDITLSVDVENEILEAKYKRLSLVRATPAEIALDFDPPMNRDTLHLIKRVAKVFGLQFSINFVRNRWMVDAPDNKVHLATPGVVIARGARMDPEKIIRNLKNKYLTSQLPGVY